MTHTPESVAELVKRLEEGTTGTDITKTDRFLDALMDEAAATLSTLSRRVEELEAALQAIAAPCIVPLGTDRQMYARWRKLATERVDIARAALKEKQP